MALGNPNDAIVTKIAIKFVYKKNSPASAGVRIRVTILAVIKLTRASVDLPIPTQILFVKTWWYTVDFEFNLAVTNDSFGLIKILYISLGDTLYVRKAF